MLNNLFLSFLVCAFQIQTARSIACSDDIAGAITIIEDGIPVTAYIAQTGGDDKRLTVSGASLTVKHNSRALLAAECTNFSPTMFKLLYLMGKTLSFDTDMSQVSCGCNAAVYFNQMPARNQYGQYTPSSCNDYYCDANAVCGVFCPEHDFVEANRMAYAAASHRCVKHDLGYYTDCDRPGCSKNFIKMNPSNYGPGASYVINTNELYNIAVSFESADGHNLDRIVTRLSQNGRSISMVHDDTNCPIGEMEGTAQPLRDGTVLAFSLWGNAGDMWWLDVPPCNVNDVCDTSKSVTYSNIRISSNEAIPTQVPTRAPTGHPTPGVPTQVPTRAPTCAPTRIPTRSPTSTPTAPTVSPTATPSAKPTSAPTAPTFSPTLPPTTGPTIQPTLAPTSLPTYEPTSQPSVSPTTSFPTFSPSPAPSALPTAAPTQIPTSSPTVLPTLAPTSPPTFAPTRMPFSPPTFAPSVFPTLSPTISPTTAMRTQLSFTAISTLDDVDSSTIYDADLRAFEGAVADTMEHVTPSDVAISSVTSSSRRRLLEGTTISYTITVIIEDIGFASPSDAYTSLRQQLQNAVLSGVFEAALKSRIGDGSGIWSMTGSSVVVSEGYSDTVIQTPHPSMPPTEAPPHEEKGLVDQALSFSSTGGILLSTFILIAIFICSCVGIYYFRDARFKKKRHSSLYLSQLTTPAILLPACSNRLHRSADEDDDSEEDVDDIDDDEMTADWGDIPTYQKRQFSQVMAPDEDDDSRL